MKRITLSLIAFACAIAAPGIAGAAATCPLTIAVAQSASAPAGPPNAPVYMADETKATLGGPAAASLLTSFGASAIVASGELSEPCGPSIAMLASLLK